jgi:hypothetical protein
VEAAITLEQMRLEGQEADGHQGAQHEGVRQVQDHLHPEVCDQEACHSLDLKLSPRMMKNHLDGTQEWKEGNDGQDGHGLGDLQLQGGPHQVREEDGQDRHGPGGLQVQGGHHQVCEEDGQDVIVHGPGDLHLLQGGQHQVRGEDGQDGHGPGDLQIQGGYHQVRGEEENGGAEGASRSLTQPSTSAGRSTPLTGTPKTPGRKQSNPPCPAALSPTSP